MFAIINTVDSIEGFPARGVYLFETAEEAEKWQLKTIREVYKGLHGQLPECSNEDMLDDFHDNLDAIEYFHVEEVVDMRKEVGA